MIIFVVFCVVFVLFVCLRVELFTLLTNNQ